MGADDGTSLAGTMLAIVFVIVGIAVWLLPIIVASHRHKSNVGGVAIITVLLGWTGIGWVIALVMACSAERTPPPVNWAPPTGPAYRLDPPPEYRS